MLGSVGGVGCGGGLQISNQSGEASLRSRHFSKDLREIDSRPCVIWGGAGNKPRGRSMSRCRREGRGGHCWKKGNSGGLWLNLVCLEVPTRMSLSLVSNGGCQF